MAIPFCILGVYNMANGLEQIADILKRLNDELKLDNDKWACEVMDINPNYYDPVCDCEGNTYQNEAVIHCIEGKTKYKKGKCK